MVVFKVLTTARESEARRPRISPESQQGQPKAPRPNLEATDARRATESPVREQKPSMDVKPTLSQAWTIDELWSAICVQSVDVHVSCSSHSDAQLAAFFIDPRAK